MNVQKGMLAKYQGKWWDVLFCGPVRGGDVMALIVPRGKKREFVKLWVNPESLTEAHFKNRRPLNVIDKAAWNAVINSQTGLKYGDTVRHKRTGLIGKIAGDGSDFNEELVVRFDAGLMLYADFRKLFPEESNRSSMGEWLHSIGLRDPNDVEKVSSD